MAKATNFLALNDPDPKEMSVVDHLTELRQRLIICILTVSVGSVAGWFVKGLVYDLLIAPIKPYEKSVGIAIIAQKLTDPFVIELQLSIAVGIALGLPVLLYQTWMFIAPAVSVQARRHVVPFVLLGVLLFAIGGVVGYELFPLVVRFLLGQLQSLPGVKPLLNLGDYVRQLALIVLIFGAVFEMPVVLTFLSMIGLTSSRWLRSKRKYAGMLGLIGAMIITPGADPITPFITAAVIYLLYEASIISVRLIHR